MTRARPVALNLLSAIATLLLLAVLAVPAKRVLDRGAQARDVNEHIAPRYIGQRLGGRRWEVIQGSDRIGIRMRIDRVHARGL